MTYTKAGWKPVLTELNYVPDPYTVKVTADDGKVWIAAKHHKDWCQDDTCPGRIASTNAMGWSLHHSREK